MENNEQRKNDEEYIRSLLGEEGLKEVLDLEKNLNSSGKFMIQMLQEFSTSMGGDDNNEENN
jgi:hypothetical protein